MSSLLLRMFGLGAVALARAAGRNRSGGATLSWYPVSPRNLRAFHAEHPQALDPDRLINAMLRQGHHSAARYVQAELDRYEDSYPGHEIYVEVH